MNNILKNIIIASILLLALFIIYYFTLPVLNIHNSGMYFYLILVIGSISGFVLMFFSDKLREKYYDKQFKVLNFETGNNISFKIRYGSEVITKPRMFYYSFVYSIIIIVAIMVIGGFSGAKIFNAKRYQAQLDVAMAEDNEIEEDFSYNSSDVILPQIDKDLAFRLAQSSLGIYGAQYTIDYDNFTIISVNDGKSQRLVRIAPLEYSNFFVSLNRINEGTIGYIEVDVYNKTSKLVTFEDGLKYMPSAILSKDLDRHIRFHYPTAMYSEKNFEIDDEGNPYWVIPTHTAKIGLFSGLTPNGVIVVNPINGDIKKYEIGQEPSWVDRCVNQDIIAEQATNNLRYSNGFFNVHFGAKKEVFQLSDGYNYFIKGGNTYFVSCITSPNESDATSIGFIAVNLKTKEAIRYSFKGITENRARDIAMADSRVKAQKLDSTWPILIDYQKIPTYFIVLKNDVQAQKIIFINVNDGSLVAMGSTIEEAKMEYERLLADSNKGVVTENEVQGKVTHIRDLDDRIEFMIDTVDGKYFVVSPTLSLDSRFISVGDMVTIKYRDNINYYYVTSLEKTN